MDFLSDGRLVLCCRDAGGSVYVLDGVHGSDRAGITVKKIAAGLEAPLGLAVVEDRIFVLQRQELSELIDYDGDEVTDEYRCVCDDWQVSTSAAEVASGLVHKDGWFYLNLGVDPAGSGAGRQAPDRGRTLRVELETGKPEYLNRGLRAPGGIGLGVDREIFLTDGGGDWLPKLLHLVPGAFHGFRAALPADWKETPVTPPVVWLPHGEVGGSPGEPAMFAKGPFAGQLAVPDAAGGGIKRVFVEKVKGSYQGAVFRFTQGLEAGIHRMKIRPGDGSIFVGGSGSLQRLRPRNEASFEILAMRALANGFELEFSEALADGHGWEPKDYACRTRDGTSFHPHRVSVAKDRRRVFMEIPGLSEGQLLHLRLARTLRSSAHRALWSTEAWYTLNRIPEEPSGRHYMPPPAVYRNTLSEADRAAGWKLLFDGSSLAGWRAFRKKELPKAGWEIRDECLSHVARKGGGDIVTLEQYEDFEFECEWKVAPGANSGIMYLVSEAMPVTWMTGPEMQVLDDRLHPDGKKPETSAGALYGLIRCARKVVRPAGEFNHTRILKQGSKVEHWLNGYKVVDYDLEDPAFAALVQKSKFAKMPGFAKELKGHIALQDHGDDVWYRNLRIRTPK
ncbi:MAG: DUF1080 domain-containing protein [Planctomycetota bacterium]